MPFINLANDPIKLLECSLEKHNTMEPASHCESLILYLKKYITVITISSLFPPDKFCAFYWHNCDTCAETPVT